MERINVCPACRNHIKGIKTRLPVPHTCGQTPSEIIKMIKKYRDMLKKSEKC